MGMTIIGNFSGNNFRFMSSTSYITISHSGKMGNVLPAKICLNILFFWFNHQICVIWDSEHNPACQHRRALGRSSHHPDTRIRAGVTSLFSGWFPQSCRQSKEYLKDAIGNFENQQNLFAVSLCYRPEHGRAVIRRMIPGILKAERLNRYGF